MKQKGGSVASDAVTSLVSADTYTKMNAGFTNNYANGQCGGSLKCSTCGGKVQKQKLQQEQKLQQQKLQQDQKLQQQKLQKQQKLQQQKLQKQQQKLQLQKQKLQVKKLNGGNQAPTPSLGDFMKSLSSAMAPKSNFVNSSMNSMNNGNAMIDNPMLKSNFANSSMNSMNNGNSMTPNVKAQFANSLKLQNMTRNNVSKFMNAAPKELSLPTSIPTSQTQLGGKKLRVKSKSQQKPKLSDKKKSP
jgi:ferredoxin